MKFLYLSVVLSLGVIHAQESEFTLNSFGSSPVSGLSGGQWTETVTTNVVGNGGAFGGGRVQYQCPAGFTLIGSQCKNLDPRCNINPIIPVTPAPPVIPRYCTVTPTVINQPLVQCPSGSYLQNGQCVSVNVRIVCPSGTVLEGNSCVYYVQGNGGIGVDVRCPPNTQKDSLRNVCIYEAQPLTLSIQCPPNTERRGDFCVMQAVPIQFRCSDGSLPVNNFCTVSASGTVKIQCPSGSRDIGNNVCEVMPPVVRYLCPDGRPAVGNTCTIGTNNVPVPEVVVQCPTGSMSDGFNRCVFKMTTDITPPKIDFDCPPHSEKRGNVCWLQISEHVPKVKFVCPRDSEQTDERTCVYNIPHVDFDFYCPPGFEKHGLKCIHTIRTDRCSETHQSFGEDCESTQTSEPVIYNNNTVHAPTNITSTNIHNINISSNDCGNGAKERVIVTNGKTERIPCPVQVPVRVPVQVPVRVPQPYPVPVPVMQPMMQPMMPRQSGCCTVQTQQCSAPNMCEYVPQQQCGSACGF